MTILKTGIKMGQSEAVVVKAVGEGVNTELLNLKCGGLTPLVRVSTHTPPVQTLKPINQDPDEDKRTWQEKTTKKKPNQKTEKRETNTPNKDKQCSDKYMQRRGGFGSVKSGGTITHTRTRTTETGRPLGSRPALSYLQQHPQRTLNGRQGRTSSDRWAGCAEPGRGRKRGWARKERAVCWEREAH